MGSTPSKINRNNLIIQQQNKQLNVYNLQSRENEQFFKNHKKYPQNCYLCQTEFIYHNSYDQDLESQEQQQPYMILQPETFCQKLNYYCCCNSCQSCQVGYEPYNKNKEHENSYLRENEKGNCEKCWYGTKCCYNCLCDHVFTFKYCKMCYQGGQKCFKSISDCCGFMYSMPYLCCKCFIDNCGGCVRCCENFNAGCQICCGYSCWVSLVNAMQEKNDNEFGLSLENYNPCAIYNYHNNDIFELLTEFRHLTYIEHKYLGKGSLIIHQQQQEVLFLMEKTFWNLTNLQKWVEPFDKRQKLKCVNLFQLRHIISEQSEGFFVTEYKVYMFFDHTTTDLNQEINFRIENKMLFKDIEIINFIEGMINALYYLQTSVNVWLNNLTAKRIFITPDGIFKLTDPSLFSFQPYYEKIYKKRQKRVKGKFLSPSQVLGLKNDVQKPLHDVYKSDIFTVGMIALQMCTLQDLENVYDYKNGEIYHNTVQSLLIQVKNQYNKKIYDLLNSMLQFDENERPSTQQLQQKFINHPMTQRKPLAQYNNFDYFQQSDSIQNSKNSLQQSQKDTFRNSLKGSQIFNAYRNKEVQFFGTINNELRNSYGGNQSDFVTFNQMMQMREENIPIQLSKIDLRFAQNYLEQQGQGKYVFQDNSYYIGSWYNNCMNGAGTLYYSNGDKAYEGYFINNQFEGVGDLYNQKQNIDYDMKKFDPINFRDTFKNQWKKYSGEFQKSLWQGKGKLILSNNDYFEGEFYRGLPNGLGQYFQIQDGAKNSHHQNLKQDLNFQEQLKYEEKQSKYQVKFQGNWKNGVLLSHLQNQNLIFSV
ncbi:Protein kinase-like domain [Pseudocohnilembus persalinus]|uniref:Protein kinase-like domain n=1 Tax=Pseudocohnilembus persalinus TaxID=266149 RepID=A0A0V0R2T9_PSEPJ|nr:Protein kinase-like domain [Pseudocohnilembus persalinus]|eukprot:KRX08501.1 Protein kinase-like domain [Pseudocohnilembus persalinus]